MSEVHGTDTCRLVCKEKHKHQMCIILLASTQISRFFTVLSGIDWMFVLIIKCLGCGMGLKAWIFQCKQNAAEILGLDLKLDLVFKVLLGGYMYGYSTKTTSAAQISC